MLLTPKQIKDLRAKGRALDPILRIGKNGITPPILEEIEMHLKKRNLIKVRFLQSCLENNDRKELAEKIANVTRAQIIDQVGFLVVLYKK